MLDVMVRYLTAVGWAFVDVLDVLGALEQLFGRRGEERRGEDASLVLVDHITATVM